MAVEWKKLAYEEEITTHAALTTGVHGLGVYVIGASTSEAVTLYVDAGSGNDANAGTSGSPKATIKGALDALPPIIAHAATICVRPGTYAESNTQIDFDRFSTLAAITIKAVNSSDEDMYDAGLATSGGNTSLTQSTKSWSTDQFNGAYIWIYEGTGAGQIREISDTTATVITVSAAWDTNPDDTSYYTIGGGVDCVVSGGGEPSSQFRVAGKRVDFYGLRMKGATTACLRFDSGSLCRIYNCYFDEAVRGIYAWGAMSLECQYTHINATNTGIDMIEMCAATFRRCVVADAVSGVSCSRMSLINSWNSTSRRNFIIGCTTGILIEYGSGGRDIASGCVFSGCTTDIDPAVSETVPNWWN